MNTSLPRPIALIILDGWGHRDSPDANAILAAKKPNWDYLWKTHAHALISGSGRCVGLPEGQMGNSEVGHLNMGAGRIVHQDFTRIDHAIESGDFFKNETLIKAINIAKKNRSAVHVMGLLSPGGVHSHERHIHAFLALAANHQLDKCYLHAFLDGRDTPPKSAQASLETLDAHCRQLQCGKVTSMVGRYYAMDRDKRWDRVQLAYDLLVDGQCEYVADNVTDALNQAYARGETDEFVKPTRIGDPVTMHDGDVVIFMNFRSDRARELTQAFINPYFHDFARRTWPHLGMFVSLAEYDPNFQIDVAFPPEPLTHLFADIISQHGMKQLRIAETEKYAHVTFFFNGGIEIPYPGEERILIPSPSVATYDLTPAMSAVELTDRLVNEIESKQYDVIICNFANPDMVGHTGNFDATVLAIETIDACLGRIATCLKQVGGEAIITADHGNAEMMFDQVTKQPHTAHTADPVPFLYIGRNAKIINENGKLSDIAPTLLYLLNLPQPHEMTGKNLLTLV